MAARHQKRFVDRSPGSSHSQLAKNMTYILGIKNNGVGAIISDTMVTFDRGDPGFYALKTGFLFHGCTYGASGDAYGFRRFVIQCKNQLDGTRDTINGFWKRFLKLVDAYEFDGHGHFELLLLSRNNGSPNFYILNSKTKTVTKAPDFVSIGAGKALLDPLMRTFRNEEHDHCEKVLAKDGWPAFYWPFYYCRELMGFAQGSHYAALQKVGVGGVFHYHCQTAEWERTQEAALYAVINIFEHNNQLTYTIYRVLFGEMALVVENAATEEAVIALDAAAFPEIVSYNESKIAELKKKILADAHKQSQCRFAGFVFADPKYHGIIIALIRGDDTEEPITVDGKIHELIHQQVENAILVIDSAS